MENGSKNRCGSYKDNCDSKVIKQYADISLGKKCYYLIIKEYFSKLPKDAPDDVFTFILVVRCPRTPMTHGSYVCL